jgi:chemotaxis protein CheD
MTLTETMVRMGDLAVSAHPADVLVSIGLGSCIGLVLVDRAQTVAGLAHVMLPGVPAAGHGATPGKYADTALPELIDLLERAGARRTRLEVVLVGGAQMFSFGGGQMDVGARNEAGVREALKAARLPVRAAATGGGKGRTVRVRVGTGIVVVKEAGGPEAQLLSPGTSRR